MERLLTIKDVATTLTLSPFTVKRMLKVGVLPFVRINRNVIRIREEDLQKLIRLRLTRADYWKASKEESEQETEPDDRRSVD